MFENILNNQGLVIVLGILAILSIGTVFIAYLNRRATSRLQRMHKTEVNQLQQDVQAMAKSAVGMGQKVLEMERRLNDVLKKQFTILNSQPEHPSYDQATRLIAMGASQQDLVNSCGFSHAEAELLFSLNKYKNDDRKTLQ